MGEIAKELKVKEHTLRYYEQIGFIAPKRDENNVRWYSKEDRNWIEFVLHMKQTGMTLENLKTYFNLWHSEDGLDELLQILRNHRQSVQEQLAIYQANLELIDKKIAFYEKSKEPGFEKNLFQTFVDEQQSE
ncbi:MerR family transcriptional regulator [Shouchella xiaoxiensis]|uniref:MerR family transcriptional regulator n=1 Tax=Shouchella xiaoxiensis TaxID=766895 RepID=UPI003462AFD6